MRGIHCGKWCNQECKDNGICEFDFTEPNDILPENSFKRRQEDTEVHDGKDNRE